MLTRGQVISIVALLNAMLGGTILVIPLIGIKTGYLMIPAITLYFGILSGYTTYLVVIHLGHSKTIKQAIFQHFHGRKIVPSIINFIFGLSLFAVLISYFQLFIKQIQGFVQPSPILGIISFIFLIFFTILMQKFDVSDKFLALGIVSIIGYVIFLFWAQATSPSGPKVIEPVDTEYIDLAAALVMGYAVQNLVDKIIIKNSEPHQYSRIIIVMAIGGIIAYTYISYGCYAIINRQPRVQTPQTIEQYFDFGGWQVGLIQVLYFIHLLSALPQFCLIVQFRILHLCTGEQQEQQEGQVHSETITLNKVIIIVLIYSFVYVIYITGVKIATIIELNGSILGVLYVILFPIFMHIKCVYFSRHDEDGVAIYQKYDSEKEQLIECEGKCKCKIQYTNNITKYLQLLYLLVGVGVAIYVVYYTIWGLFKQPQTIQTQDL